MIETLSATYASGRSLRVELVRLSDKARYDWATLTFKSSGWAVRYQTMIEDAVTPGWYVTTLDLDTLADGDYEALLSDAAAGVPFSSLEITKAAGVLTVTAPTGAAAGYTTVGALRSDEGVPATVSDARLLALGALAKRYIDWATGLWFDLRTFAASGGNALVLEGRNTPILEFPAPIQRVDALKIDGQLQDAATYVVYSRRPETGAEDYWYPRIEFQTLLRLERSLGPQYARQFPARPQNVTFEGQLGWIEADGSTPVGIQRACALLVVGLMKPVSGDDRLKRSLQSETIGNYSYSRVQGAFSAMLTGDVELQALLGSFRRAGWIYAA